MKKILFSILLFVGVGCTANATCYIICTPNGDLLLLITDPVTDAPVSSAVVSNNCTGGPYVYELEPLAGMADQDATDMLLLFVLSDLKPCTPAESSQFCQLLRGDITTKHPDLKQLPQATIDFLRTH